ncbi:MAG: alpha-galactosidase [Actinomyces sp.]|nr:alpha-galactosidase [Actinomyces sp.]MCI1787619.1 alpha-galactosidase [Actinomyces sp.]MCI1830173.1 alpha-galactosidase [Actinomyces sp.]MCI1866741.1 alpha-galactosidase [Actinomyces sp.]
MNLAPVRADIVHLRAGGTSLVIQAPHAQAPEVLHWGKDLGAISASVLRTLSVATEEPYDGNAPNEPLQVGVIPLSSTGWMGRPGLVGHRSGGRDWAPHLRTSSTVVEAADIVVEATTAGGDLAVASGGAGRVSYTLADEDAGLSVRILFELLDTGLVRARAKVGNTGADDYDLDEVALAFPLPLEADEILDFSGRWGREREPQRLPVRLGCHLHEGRHGRTGFDAPMMLFCGESGFGFAHGRVWGLHVACSGNHRTWVERCHNGRQVIGGGELLLPGEVSLGPGETYTTPWIYLQSGDGLDEVARRLHRWERSLPSHPDPDRPVTMNVWEAVYFDHNLDTLLRLADQAGSIGAERYVLDDGWFLHRRNDRAGLGDWTVDPQVWPQGLHPLVDRVRALGMQFGLWVEPEMINVDSDLARAHPEWILRAGTDLPLEWRNQQVLNLALPEAWEHIRACLDALIEEYDIDYLKWDHNRDLIDAGDATHAGRAVVHEQTLACYRLMDALRADHPGLEIESCSSGGGRIDLEMLTHAQRFWLSDCIDPHERQQIMRWTEQLVAPEYMGTHVASPHSHTTGRTSNLAFRAGTALWGHFGFEWDLLGLDEDELARVREWVDFYKEHRRMLLTGDLVRRDIADGSVWLHGIVAPDGSRALYELVTRSRSPLSPRGMLHVPGLNPDGLYELCPRLVGGGPEGLFLAPWAQSVGDDGTIMTGRCLDEVGVHLPLLYPDQVLLLEAKEVEN